MSRRAFTDPAGGSGGDSYTLAIARDERRGDVDVLVLELVREVKPPFSPEAVTAEFASVVKAYGLSEVTGDRYAGEWPREAFRKHGVEYVPSPQTKSELYAELLPLINSGRIELLDHPRLLAQLGGLERRTARGGRDTIDHAPGAHDDVANAVAGALVLVARDVAGDDMPLMLIGSEAYREWEAQHGGARQSSMQVALPEADDVVEEPNGPDPSPNSPLAPLRALARQKDNFMARLRRMREEASDPRSQPHLLADVGRAVLGSKSEAEAAAAAAKAADGAIERRQARESARWLDRQVRRNGGCWMPGDL